VCERVRVSVFVCACMCVAMCVSVRLVFLLVSDSRMSFFSHA